jgi:CBS domain-containing protein
MNAPVSTLLESKTTTVFSVPVTVTVSEAVQEMNRRKIGSVLVMEGGVLVGIFTERDVLMRVVAAERDPKTTPVAHVMTRSPITIPSSMTVEEVMDLHSGKHFRHLPVVENGRVIGMISVRDILRWLAEANSKKADQLEDFIESGNCVS